MDKQQIESLIQAVIEGESVRDTIEDWFENNPSESAILGLTPTLVRQLSDKLENDSLLYTGSAYYEKIVNEFLAEQTFTDSRVSSLAIATGLLDAIKSLVDWTKAPRNATGCQIKRVWLDSRGIVADYQVLHDEPRPKPLVVDQTKTYVFKGVKYTVCSVGKLKLGQDLIDCVTYAEAVQDFDTEIEYVTRTVTDFLDKFQPLGD